MFHTMIKTESKEGKNAEMIKFIALEILMLIIMLLCGTVTMKILDILFKLEYEDIWVVGFRVGFAVWLFLLTVTAIVKLKNKH